MHFYQNDMIEIYAKLYDDLNNFSYTRLNMKYKGVWVQLLDFQVIWGSCKVENFMWAKICVDNYVCGNFNGCKSKNYMLTQKMGERVLFFADKNFKFLKNYFINGKDTDYTYCNYKHSNFNYQQ